MDKILLIAAGGSIGSVLRYIITISINRFNLNNFFFGTVIINIIGCLLIGLGYSFFGRGNNLLEGLKIFFVTGFLGAFTTFSAYGIESAQYVENGLITHFICNILITNIIGIAMVFIGIYIGRQIWN